VAGWSCDQLITFLEKLGELRALTPLHASTSQALAQLYGLLATKNAEVRCAYYKLAIPGEDHQVLGPCVELLKTQVGLALVCWCTSAPVGSAAVAGPCCAAAVSDTLLCSSSV
jgi:hypothetical protein